MESFIRGYQLIAFGHVSSQTGNTRNKSASFLYLDMGARPLFSIFSLFKLSITESPKIFKQIFADLFVITRNDHLTTLPCFIDIHGTKRHRQ